MASVSESCNAVHGNSSASQDKIGVLPNFYQVSDVISCPASNLSSYYHHFPAETFGVVIGLMLWGYNGPSGSIVLVSLISMDKLLFLCFNFSSLVSNEQNLVHQFRFYRYIQYQLKLSMAPITFLGFFFQCQQSLFFPFVYVWSKQKHNGHQQSLLSQTVFIIIFCCTLFFLTLVRCIWFIPSTFLCVPGCCFLSHRKNKLTQVLAMCLKDPDKKYHEKISALFHAWEALPSCTGQNEDVNQLTENLYK